MNKVRALLQAVGFLTLALLAIYGVLAIAGGAGPLPGALSARAQEALPNPAVSGTELVTGTLTSAPAAPNTSIAPTVNYQGILRKGETLVQNGTYTITARIYDDLNKQPKDALYTTTKTGVTVRDGVFNIILGDGPALTANAFSDTPRYIGITLNSGPELSPRQRVHSVPWAMTASTLVENASVGNFSSNRINAVAFNGGTVTVSGAVNAGSAAVTGALTTGALTAGSAGVTGNLTTGNLTAGSAGVTGSLTTGSLTSGPATVNGNLDMKRSYKMFAAKAQYNHTESKPLGEWDVCVLSGVYFEGLDIHAGDFANCSVRAQDMAPYNYVDSALYVMLPGQHINWYLDAGATVGTDWTWCEAVCMNIGW